MSEQPKVVFESDLSAASSIRPFREKPVSGMAGWVIRSFGGVAKNEKEANAVLFIAALLIFALSVFIFIMAGEKPGGSEGASVPIPAGPGDPRYRP